MAKESIYVIQPSFATGEVSPDVANRVDMEKYASAVINAENTYVRPYGSIYKRGGTIYCGKTKYADKDCIIEEFSSEGGSYLLEIGEKYIRIWKDDHWLGVEVTTPYTEAELHNLRFCQSADVKFIASGTHPVMTLSRYSDTDWRFGEFEITKPYFDISLTSHAKSNAVGMEYKTAGDYTFAPKETAVYQIECAGAGGGNGGGASGAGKTGYGGSGGNGALVSGKYTLEKGKTYSIHIGAGGTNGTEETSASSSGSFTVTGTTGGTGGNSSVASLCSASGGTGGTGGKVTRRRISKRWRTTATNGTSGANAGNGSGATAGRAGWVYIKTTTDGQDMIKPSAMAGNISLESKTPIFSNALIGSHIQIQHELAAQTVSADGAQTTNSILCGDAWKLITHGTWTGEVKIQKSDDNTNWKDYRTYKSNDDFNASESGTFDAPTYMRLVTTGGKADLTAYAYTHTGEVELTGITDSTHASARVVENLGSTDWTQDYYFSAWNNLMGYPRCVGFFQDRFMLGATNAQPYMIWGSRTGDYPNFSKEKVSGTITDDSAVAMPFISRDQKDIQHIVPAADLIIMTSGNEWVIPGSDTLTPTKGTPKPQSSRGSNEIAPILIGTRVIYIQKNGRTVRDMGYSFESDAYDGMDLTLLAKSLTNGKSIVSAAYMQDPDSRLYFVRSDGVMLCLSYVQDQKVYAWSHLVTDGKYKSVANITGDEDRVYAVVERTLNGKTVRTIERFTGYAETTDPNDYVLLDAAITLEDSEGTDTGTAPHLAGMTVGVLGDGRFYENVEVASDGTFEIEDEVHRMTVGIPYTMKIAMPNIDVQAQNGTIQGRYKKVASVTLRLVNSLGGYLGGNEDLMDEIKYDELSEQDVTLFNGDKDVTVPEGFNTKGQILITSTDPYPFTLAAMIREVVISNE